MGYHLPQLDRSCHYVRILCYDLHRYPMPVEEDGHIESDYPICDRRGHLCLWKYVQCVLSHSHQSIITTCRSSRLGFHTLVSVMAALPLRFQVLPSCRATFSCSFFVRPNVVGLTQSTATPTKNHKSSRKRIEWTNSLFSQSFVVHIYPNVAVVRDNASVGKLWLQLLQVGSLSGCA